MMVLVSYDVSVVAPGGKKRLRHVAKACTNYGQRVQNSVFECLIDPAQWTALKHQLIEICDPTKDSLRFYFLGAHWQRRVEHYGTKGVEDLQDGTLIA
jgi:CRISPR-associated protein Cas2